MTYSVWTMYGGKATLYLAMSAKLAKIQGRPGLSGWLDEGWFDEDGPGQEDHLLVVG